MDLRPARALTTLALSLLAAPLLAQDQDGKPEEPPSPPPFRMMSEFEADESIPRGIQVNEAGAFDGYTLVWPLVSKKIHLVDMEGDVVHEWVTEHGPGGGCYLLDDGTILRCSRVDEDPKFRGGGVGGRIEKIAPDGSVVWSWRLANDDYCQHHDIEPLPNGNVLLIAWERIPQEDALARGRSPKHVGKVGLWSDVVLEVRPIPPDDAKIVWEWHAWDHVVQDADTGLEGYGFVPEEVGKLDVNADHRGQPPLTAAQKKEQEELEKKMRALGYAGGDDDEEEDDGEADDKWQSTGDWLHTNSVEYHPELDLIALSSPHLCEIWVVDHSTTKAEAASTRGGRWGRGGEILWRWGNPRNYGSGKKKDQRLFYQHHPTWVTGEDGSVRLLVFNNGRGRKGGDFSSVDELVLPLDPKQGFQRERGKAFGPTEPAWSYSDPDTFYSAFISGAQRLPNGNTLICSGTGGRLFEVTRDNEVVWDYRNPFGGDIKTPDHAGQAPPLALFRGTRIAPDHPGVKRLLER